MRLDVAVKRLASLTLLLAAAALAGCAENAKPIGQPTFYNSMAQPDVTLDANAAASMISGYRVNNGLTPVMLDPQLMQLAEARARAMAERNRVDQNLGG